MLIYLIILLIATSSIVFLLSSAKFYHWLAFLLTNYLSPLYLSTCLTNDYPNIYTFFNLLIVTTDIAFFSNHATLLIPIFFLAYGYSISYLLTRLTNIYYNNIPRKPRILFSHSLLIIFIILWLSIIYVLQNKDVFHIFSKLFLGFCHEQLLADFTFISGFKTINFITYYSLFCVTFFPESTPYAYLIIPMLQLTYIFILHVLVNLYRDSRNRKLNKKV